MPRGRRQYWGLLASFLLHGLLVLLVLVPLWRRLAQAVGGPSVGAAATAGGGGGGSRERYISLPAFSPPARVLTPVVAPPVTPPIAVVKPVPAAVVVDTPVATVAQASEGERPGAEAAPGEGPGAGGGTGGGENGGVGEGTGPGSGPGEGGGVEARPGRPPRPKQEILPPIDGVPKELRGQMITVTYTIAADGRIERVEITPDIRDKGFAKKFRERMEQYQFRPGLSPEGAPVASTVTYTVQIN